MKISTMTRLMIINLTLWAYILGGCNGSKRWNEIVAFFNADTLTLSSAKSRLSDQALEAIVPIQKVDSLSEIKSFFSRLKDNQDYKTTRKSDTVKITHHPGDQLGEEPYITIVENNGNWFIAIIARGI